MFFGFNVALHYVPMIIQCSHLCTFGLQRRETGNSRAANAARGQRGILYEFSPQYRYHIGGS